MDVKKTGTKRPPLVQIKQENVVPGPSKKIKTAKKPAQQKPPIPTVLKVPTLIPLKTENKPENIKRSSNPTAHTSNMSCYMDIKPVQTKALTATPSADVQAILSYIKESPWRSSQAQPNLTKQPTILTKPGTSRSPANRQEVNQRNQSSTVEIEPEQIIPVLSASSMSGSHLQFLPRSRNNSFEDYFDSIDNLTNVLPSPEISTNSPKPQQQNTASSSILNNHPVQCSNAITKRDVELIHTKLDYILDAIHDRRELSERGSSNVFNFEPIKDLATLNEFERQLGETNGAYRDQIFNTLHSSIKKGNSKYQIHQAIDKLLDRKFVTEITWSDRTNKGEKKIAFSTYTNIKKLFVDIAGTMFEQPTEQFVYEYLGQKFRHASNRVNILGKRTTTPHNVKRKI
ncbi:uncharacterized protein LOC133392945 isoform X2 [Anopheles gambiae]|nr:uncharacterized protein LOC133392945 isoform X2 [Anopheles gambiae]